MLGARFKGNPATIISGVNEIHKVEPGDITFVDFDKYYEMALQSEASVILIDKEIEGINGKGLIISDDPFNDYNYLTRTFKPFEPANKQISDSSVIGEHTVIQPGVFIGNHVTIGDNCIIHANVSICDYTTIGDNVVINPNAVIGSDAFYFKKRPAVNGTPAHYDKLLSSGKTIIENDVEIGSGCTIDRGVSGDTIIGKGTKLDNLIHIGHGTVIGENCLFAAHVGVAGKVKIGNNVSLWGQVGVSKDLEIADGTVVLAQSGVGETIKEPNKVWFGSPIIEARKKWREIAMVRKLPAFWEKLREL